MINNKSKDSTTKINNTYDYFTIPGFKFNESIVLNLIYDINSWKTCLEYCNKYKNTIHKNTIKRIITYAWVSFYSTYKVNIDNITNIYLIYLQILNIEFTKEDIAKKIYEIKKLDLNINEINYKLFKTFEK
jgi:hypothetical protein